mmetsp:Transcript_44093/g.134266  ORF Transcript_44093/g.134266 Transcript_44093/m.134266 type:complete len:194 (-) Transcript_44093:1979-2560(-)
MDVAAFVKPFLSSDELEEVRLWYRNLKHPPTHRLAICPRKRCGERAMRRTEDGSQIVFCDSCGWTCCELCLAKVEDSHEDCDPTAVVRLCRRYRRASDEIKSACEERWPWINNYAEAHFEDDLALKWVKENASRCPRCRVGIERSEGCFHMHCRECGTHFCYECGEELRQPYYGTHHCWEQNALNDRWFQFDD